MIKLAILISKAQLAVYSNGAWHTVKTWELPRGQMFAQGGMWALKYEDVEDFAVQLDSMAAQS